MNHTILNSTKITVLIISLLAIFSCQNKRVEHQTTELNKELDVVLDSISELMSRYHYNPEELKSKAYLDVEKKARLLAKESKSKEGFVKGYNALWAKGPFSHVRLAGMQTSAQDMAKFIDTLRVGEYGSVLEWMNNTAILTLTTMTGLDTKERVFDAYKKIAEKVPENLIIDLRNNEGGTFAGVPLIAHLISDSLDIGMFVSQKWWRNNTDAPILDDSKKTEPWQGWSIESFWHDVQENPLTRVQIQPMTPRFEGHVYVLISDKTFSAAEFTSDALAHVENITIIGETTAGEMLSQKMYDLPMGLQLSLPIADYYSVRIGRIEGKGVEPDIKIDARVAKELAIALIEEKELEEAIVLAKSKILEMDRLPFEGKTLRLFGSMNEWGKKSNMTPKFEYKGGGVFSTTVTLSKGKHEFKIAPMDWDFDFGAFDDKKEVGIEEKTPLIKKPGSPNLILELDSETELIFSLAVSKENEAILSISKNSSRN